MLHKLPFSSLKRLLLIPIIGGMMTFASCADNSKKVGDEDQEEVGPAVRLDGSKQIQDITALSSKDIDKTPVYPGCEGNKEELEDCMLLKITQVIDEKFEKVIGKKLNSTGRQQMHVEFRINREGVVTDVRAQAKHREFEEEVIRVMENFIPKMEPAILKGEATGVNYSLPLIIEM